MTLSLSIAPLNLDCLISEGGGFSIYVCRLSAVFNPRKEQLENQSKINSSSIMHWNYKINGNFEYWGLG